MSKVLSATCLAGVVKVGLLPVPEAIILSEGLGASTGVAVIDEDEVTYIAKTTPDLNSTLDQLIDSLDKIASTLNTIATSLTSIGAGMTGPTTAPPPTLAANVASIVTNAIAITAAQTQLEALQEVLK